MEGTKEKRRSMLESLAATDHFIMEVRGVSLVTGLNDGCSICFYFLSRWTRELGMLDMMCQMWRRWLMCFVAGIHGHKQDISLSKIIL